MIVPLDEYPVHQAPLSMAYTVNSDRNFYDRCYFNGHDRTGDIFLITGLGVYPNLGTIDAYATIRRGDRHVTVRISDALSDDRMHQQVGPYRIEVIEPLTVIRVVCDADDPKFGQLGLGFDLTWRGSFPVVEEPPHIVRKGNTLMLDAQRFAQVGTWEGEIRIDGDTIAVSPGTWVGSRDRSWGIRPVGESTTPGRWEAERDPNFGFWWLYVPMRFDDYGIVVICQDQPDGTRVMNEAVRVWPSHTGRKEEQLGWPDVEIRYQSGTRLPTGATIAMRKGRSEVVMEVESLNYVALNLGPGYGNDPAWNHGMWKGRNFIERVEHDLTDPRNQAMVPFATIDHVARATVDGDIGFGLFEHSNVGRHDPSGFADFTSVAL